MFDIPATVFIGSNNGVPIHKVYSLLTIRASLEEGIDTTPQRIQDELGDACQCKPINNQTNEYRSYEDHFTLERKKSVGSIVDPFFKQ